MRVLMFGGGGGGGLALPVGNILGVQDQERGIVSCEYGSGSWGLCTHYSGPAVRMAPTPLILMHTLRLPVCAQETQNTTTSTVANVCPPPPPPTLGGWQGQQVPTYYNIYCFCCCLTLHSVRSHWCRDMCQLPSQAPTEHESCVPSDRVCVRVCVC